jgi:hypothetical protein
VPFVRFSRDKRGYEYVFLVDVPPQQANARARVLYWYRTPPGMKVGRQPFDEAVRKALEAQYPDLKFDWKQIVETPMPPVEVTINWRERRRVERAAKRARLQDELEEAQAAESTAAEGESHRAEGESHTDDAGNGEDAPNGLPPSQDAENAAAKRPAGRRRRRRRSRGGRPNAAAIQTSVDQPQQQGETREPADGAEHNDSERDEHSPDQDD